MRELSSLELGALVKDPNSLYNGVPVVWRVIDKNHSGYPTDSVTLISDKILSLKPFDAKEPSSTNAVCQIHGNNRYIYSNIRQWLNSAAGPGQWYSAQCEGDMPPSPDNVYKGYNAYDQEAGFLFNFSTEFREALLLTTHKAVIHSSSWYYSSEDCEDKIFLPTVWEMCVSYGDSIGTPFSLFKSDRRFIPAYPTIECIERNEYPDIELSISEPYNYWANSSYQYSDGQTHYLGATFLPNRGGDRWDYSYRGYIGVRPICNLSSSTLLSDEIDSDGAYNIIWKGQIIEPPTSITVPRKAIKGENLTVVWEAPSDTTFTVAGYVLERQYNGGIWKEVYRGSNLEYTDLVLPEWKNIVYRVKAYDGDGIETEYKLSYASTTMEGVRTLGSLGVGDLVRDTNTLYNGKPIVWKIADKDHPNYPPRAVTLVTDKIISQKSFDAAEPGSSNSQRRSFGNNRYIYSNIRQWLNSEADIGEWYIPQHDVDASPAEARVYGKYNEYDQEAGFLYGFSENFRASLMKTTYYANKSSTDGDGLEICEDKIFLASCAELGLSSNASGTKMALFTDDNSRVAYPTTECVSNSEYIDSNFVESKAWYWFVRDARSDNDTGTYIVNTSGWRSAGNSAYDATKGGIRPFCNLPSLVYVTENPDSNNVYDILWDQSLISPTSITVPSDIHGGEPLTVVWDSSLKEDSVSCGYILERRYNGENWVQIYKGSDTSYTDIIKYGQKTVTYRVKSYNNVGVGFDYVVSGIKTIANDFKTIDCLKPGDTVKDINTLYNGQPIVWKIADKNHEGYPEDSVTLITDKIITCKEYDATDSKKGAMVGGRGRYDYSNIRQWLNSDGLANEWFVPQDSIDKPPSYQNENGFLTNFSTGFKNNILDTTRDFWLSNYYGDVRINITDKIFLPSVQETNSREAGETSRYRGTHFLIFPTYEDRESNNACLTPEALEAVKAVSTQNVVTNATTDTPYIYWLCDDLNYTKYNDNIQYNNYFRAHHISNGYAADFSVGVNYIGVRPVLNVSASSVWVNGDPDVDGSYIMTFSEPLNTPSSITVPEFIRGDKNTSISWGALDTAVTGYILERQYNEGEWEQIYSGNELTYIDTVALGKKTVSYRVKAYNSDTGSESGYRISDTRKVINETVPVISGADLDFGEKANAFSYDYTVIIPDDIQTGTIVEEIDGIQKRSYTGSSESTYTFDITPSDWMKILNGKHTGTIKVTNTNGESAIRTFTFSKNSTEIEMTLLAPIEATQMIRMVDIHIKGTIPEGSVFFIEMCNNGYDEIPFYEDVTNEVLLGRQIFLHNRTKTADKWGLNYRIKISRNGMRGDCFVTSVQGNFI